MSWVFCAVSSAFSGEEQCLPSDRTRHDYYVRALLARSVLTTW